MKRVRDYKFVYENWYKKQLKQGEKPMPLNTFFQVASLKEVTTIKDGLQNGMTIEEISVQNNIAIEKGLLS